MRALLTLSCCVALLTAGCHSGAREADRAELRPPAASGPAAGDIETARGAGSKTFTRVPGVTTLSRFRAGGGLERWKAAVPHVEEVRIPSSVDEHEQPALWLPPDGPSPRPLLVVVHSWSYGYLQTFSIPFGQWAQARGWAMIHPHFRGPFERPAATGSDLAVRDVIDAVDFAQREAAIDEDRVFVIGFSGGGLMSLLLAGRHPDRFAGAVSWVSIYDLVDWYRYHREHQPGSGYAWEILASCGGPPTTDPEARNACEHRSPAHHLDRAREAGVPVYIAHGTDDDVVPADHGLRAFNHLAEPGDRLPLAALRAARRGDLPRELVGSVEAETYFAAQDPPVVFARRSGPVTVVLFEGGHDMAYHPGLEWLVREAPAQAG